jgi:hypothetical protein
MAKRENKWSSFETHRKDLPKAGIFTYVLLVLLMAGAGAVGGVLFQIYLLSDTTGVERQGYLERTDVDPKVFLIGAGIGAALGALGVIKFIINKGQDV